VSSLKTLQQVAEYLRLGLLQTRQLVRDQFGSERDLLTDAQIEQLKIALPESVRGQSNQGALVQPCQMVLDFSHDDHDHVLLVEAAQCEASEPERALRIYFEFLARHPLNGLVHVNTGRLLHQQSRLTDALVHYQAALVVDPNDTIATYNLAVVFEDLERFDEAIVAYQKAIELNAVNEDAYFNLARLFEKKGQRMLALRHLKDYRRLTAKQ
jgi:tetratricopeptide (TPR) repeat protein